MRGRMEALGPIVADADSAEGRALLALEQEGTVMRCRFEGQDGWCHRRLLARLRIPEDAPLVVSDHELLGQRADVCLRFG